MKTLRLAVLVFFLVGLGACSGAELDNTSQEVAVGTDAGVEDIAAEVSCVMSSDAGTWVYGGWATYNLDVTGPQVDEATWVGLVYATAERSSNQFWHVPLGGEDHYEVLQPALVAVFIGCEASK